MVRFFAAICMIGVALLLSGCVTRIKTWTTVERTGSVFDDETSAMEARANQTRAFDTLDRSLVMRSTVATLQDLGFQIDTTDVDLGLLTASSYVPITATATARSSIVSSTATVDGVAELSVTVTLRSRGETQTLVRINAIYIANEMKLEQDFHQRFFAALAKSMFLSAHEVD